MTSQAERIKAFKFAQHSRLQKQIASRYSMTQYSLTDEEKLQLDFLLSDISDAEEFVNEMSNSNRSPEKAKHVSKSIDIEKMDELESNHYQFSMNDMETMKNLDWQLHEILESYKNETSDIHESFECDKDDVLQTADKEGKYWKHEHIRARLESIQKSLDQIAAQDDEDQKELTEIRSNSENNLDN